MRQIICKDSIEKESSDKNVSLFIVRKAIVLVTSLILTTCYWACGSATAAEPEPGYDAVVVKAYEFDKVGAVSQHNVYAGEFVRVRNRDSDHVVLLGDYCSTDPAHECVIPKAIIAPRAAFKKVEKWGGVSSYECSGMEFGAHYAIDSSGAVQISWQTREDRGTSQAHLYRLKNIIWIKTNKSMDIAAIVLPDGNWCAPACDDVCPDPANP